MTKGNQARKLRTAGSARARVARRLVFWVLAVAGWSIVGFLFALPGFAAGSDWRRTLLSSLAQWWAWGLLTPVIIAADRMLPFSSKQLPRRIAAQLALCAPFTIVYVYMFALVRALIGIGGWGVLIDRRLLPSALPMFLWSVLVYCLIAGVWQAQQYYQRYLSGELRNERLERSFSEARLNALRMQLDPHFLFNALNTISSQVERDPRLARQMIQHLGDLLRMSLESKDRQEVPLAHELAFLEHYLAIQKIRFGDRLTIELRIAPEVRFALVPCLFLQPLVENAIRHGISARASGGTIRISAQSYEDRIEVRVLDDGVGLPAGWAMETAAGLGLSVTRQRIRGLHADSSLKLRHDAGGGTEAVVELPLRFEAEGAGMAAEFEEDDAALI
jgi:two-component system, LytTR family, sensor kinase